MMEDNNLKNNQNTVDPKDSDVNPKDDKGKSKTGDVVSKLKERLSKKTAENSSLADQVADLRVQLQKFTQQDKANDEQASELDEAKKQLEALQLENQRIKASRQVEKDLQDAGLLSYSSDGVLEMLVGDTDKVTTQRTMAFIKFAQSLETGIRKEYHTGHTPRTSGKASLTRDEINKIADPAKRLEAIKNNLSLYN
ncbi:MAG: DUF4355 domain-containing protein [Lactobacillus iners]|nr:DUF4355 domain-containing protein [Lactobacillus iners]MCT7726746.1 DUF4355 domain-containing protein [Lactobacillus iners]MCZ9654956.1 DUF4355 domain-containing protein [Lactobacillus iners]